MTPPMIKVLCECCNGQKYEVVTTWPHDTTYPPQAKIVCRACEGKGYYEESAWSEEK